MRIERRKARAAEVYTASLNDIMFFLMLFFLIISTMVTPAAIRVLLPNAKSAENVATRKNIQLVITSDLHYFIDDKQVLKEEIEAMLSDEIAQKGTNEEINILLQADRTLNLQDVVDVIDIGNKLKVKMVLFTQKPQ